MKPLLLVDVDGVLNNFYLRQEKKGWKKYEALGYKLMLHPKHGEWLNALANRFELVWATTWEDDAPVYIAPKLNLPEMPVIHFYGGSDTGTWKLFGVQTYVADMPFAWLDDDLGADAHRWADTRDRAIPTLLLDVDERMCFLEHHVQKLEAFADRVEVGVDVSSDLSSR